MKTSHAIVAVETSVTDYYYDKASINEVLCNAFLTFHNPQRPPRAAVNLLVDVALWGAQLRAFAELHSLPVGEGSPEEQAQRVQEIIFGKPRAVKAGGALGNTVDTLFNATIDGISLADGVFVTTVGEGPAGEAFTISLADKLIMPEPRGHQMEAHIFPLHEDRIIATQTSFTNAASNHMSPVQLDDAGIGPDTKMVMLGGYMFYTGLYGPFLEKILEKVAAVSPHPEQRPAIVLTPAAQPIAESPVLHEALKRASLTAPLVVPANTGEFRRLMGLDMEWRKPHEAKWWFNAVGDKLAAMPDVGLDPNTQEGVEQLINYGGPGL